MSLKIDKIDIFYFLIKERFLFVENIDYKQNQLMSPVAAKDHQECQEVCAKPDACLTYTWYQGTCYTKFRYRFQPHAVVVQSAMSGYPVLGTNIIITLSLYIFLILHCFNLKVEYCSNRLTKIERFEYHGAHTRTLFRSLPEECCMTCYYDSDCVAWQIHVGSTLCTFFLSKNGDNIPKAPNANFISAQKPKFV